MKNIYLLLKQSKNPLVTFASNLICFKVSFLLALTLLALSHFINSESKNLERRKKNILTLRH